MKHLKAIVAMLLLMTIGFNSFATEGDFKHVKPKTISMTVAIMSAPGVVDHYECVSITYTPGVILYGDVSVTFSYGPCTNPTGTGSYYIPLGMFNKSNPEVEKLVKQIISDDCASCSIP